jgi:hypothetical protein
MRFKIKSVRSLVGAFNILNQHDSPAAAASGVIILELIEFINMSYYVLVSQSLYFGFIISSHRACFELLK